MTNSGPRCAAVCGTLEALLRGGEDNAAPRRSGEVMGGELAIRYWSVRIPVLGLPTTFNYLPIVVSGVLMCLFSLERILLRLAGEPIDDVVADATVTAD